MRKVSLFKSSISFAQKFMLTFALVLTGLVSFAQVTTSTISGTVAGKDGEGLIGATVIATHVNSGSRYGASTNATGNYTIPFVRVGGPFSITVSYTGYEPQTVNGIMTNLGSATNVDFVLAESGVSLEGVEVVASRNDIFSDDRTGASSTFNSRQINSVPVVGSRSLNEVTKYNPNGNGRSFGAQDSRLNNFTIDGSVFNNGFGLGSEAQAGGRTGSTAISLDAIEELQVNVAPFDVRQSGFVGSGINAVTRSGTNNFSGSVYFNNRNDGFFGSKAAGQKAVVGDFNENIVGARIGGPILKNKAFFFVNAELVNRTELATPFASVGSSFEGQPTRVAFKDLDSLSGFLNRKYGYETGAFENFNAESASAKFLARLDFNLNDKNKLTLRYTHHDSQADIPISNSASLGAGSRTRLFESMSYRNSGYIIEDKTRSIVAELNSTLSDRLFNNFTVGYDRQIEDRALLGASFPTVDILKDGRNYISFGLDPFTPANKLNYGTFHVTNNVTFSAGKHLITGGVNVEMFKSNNTFFPGANGVYTFNSLEDFYKAANFDGDTSPVKLSRFQYRYSALEGGAEPLQVLKSNKFDAYVQDAFNVTKNFKITAGVRASVVTFAETGLLNTSLVDSNFVDIDEQAGYKILTNKMPKPRLLWEPRLGFNLDVFGNKKTQLRGGTGIFTGRPPYVWVSNQIGNNGILTGFVSGTNTTKYKFTTDVEQFIPKNADGSVKQPTTFDIAVSDENFKFPQVWKSNLAVDQKLGGFVLTAELLYNQNINAINYWNANLPAATGAFTGPDTRPRFTKSKINPTVDQAIVMTNTNEGSYLGTTLKLEYPTQKGLGGMVAYTYSRAEDLMSAGSIASGSWAGVRTLNGANNLVLGLSDNDIPHRIIGLLNYRLDYGKKMGGATEFSLGYIGSESGRYSYSVGGDLNGDGARDNDLLYIPNNATDLKYRSLSVDYFDADGVKKNVTFTPDQQAAAFETYIQQDEYLSSRRGQYAVRNEAIFPWLHRFDFTVMQEFGITVGGKRNAIQIRADILNVGNLINNDWGVGNVLLTNRPISVAGVTTDGVPEYRMATRFVGGVPQLLDRSFVKGSSQNDVWGLQLGIRYIFN
jgi:hypothetical protein